MLTVKLLTRVPICVAIVGLSLLAAACVPQTAKPFQDDAKDLYRVVHQFCVAATPIRRQESNTVDFPQMDNQTLLAAAKLGRRTDQDRQFFGDLAAVIVRMDRAVTNPMGQYVSDNSDVTRIFMARFWPVIRPRGDELVLSELVGWIRKHHPRLLDSELLERELNLGER